MLNPPATGIMQEADSAELLPGQQVDRVSILNADKSISEVHTVPMGMDAAAYAPSHRILSAFRKT